MDCPQCGNTVRRRIPNDSSFTLDTMGTLGFCITADYVYVHLYEDVRDSDDTFVSYNSATETIE